MPVRGDTESETCQLKGSGDVSLGYVSFHIYFHLHNSQVLLSSRQYAPGHWVNCNECVTMSVTLDMNANRQNPNTQHNLNVSQATGGYKDGFCVCSYAMVHFSPELLLEQLQSDAA